MNNMKLQKTLDKIREVNGLKKLKFGCVVEVLIPEYGTQDESGSEYSPMQIGYATYIEPSEPMTFLDGSHLYDIYASDFKNGEIEYVDDEDGITATIIGLPIHLEHLLYVIEKNQKEKMVIFSENRNRATQKLLDLFDLYDLQKSVEQNLKENPELLNLVAELLGITE